MREIKVEHDREWLVIVTTRYRVNKAPLVKRTYFSKEEAALVIGLLKAELPEVTLRRVE